MTNFLKSDFAFKDIIKKLLKVNLYQMCTYLVKFINTCLRDVHSPLPFCFILSGIPVGLMENNDADKKETDDSTPQRCRKVRGPQLCVIVDA